LAEGDLGAAEVVAGASAVSVEARLAAAEPAAAGNFVARHA
jgi:hypothetical protein